MTTTFEPLSVVVLMFFTRSDLAMKLDASFRLLYPLER